MKKYLTYGQALGALSLLEEAPVDAWPDAEMRGIALLNKNEALKPIQNQWESRLQRAVEDHVIEPIDTDNLPTNGEGEYPEDVASLTQIEVQLGARLDDPGEVSRKIQSAQQEEVEVRLAVYGDGPGDYEEARERCEEAAEAITEARDEDAPSVKAEHLSFMWPIKR